MTAVALALTLSSFTALLWAGVGHALRPKVLRGDLESKALAPFRPIVPAVGGLVVAIEVSVGAGGAATMMAGASVIFNLASWTAIAAVQLGAYATYVAWLYLRRPGAHCGCGASSSQPVTGWTIARALLFAGYCVAGLLFTASVSNVDVRAHDTIAAATLVTASIAVAVLTWSLPGAFATPRVSTTSMRVS